MRISGCSRGRTAIRWEAKRMTGGEEMTLGLRIACLLGFGVVGQDLGGILFRPSLKHNVGKGASDIGADANLVSLVTHS